MTASVPPKAGSLGPQVLHLLRTQIHRLGTSDVLALRELIECPSMISSEHHKQSLHALVGLGNGLDRYVTDSTIAMHCMLPLLIWAKPSDGAEHIVGRVPNWAIFHTTKPDEDMESANNALAMINALREDLTAAQLHSFANYWQEERKTLLWKDIYSRAPDHIQAWTDTVIELGLLHAYTRARGLRSAPSSGQRWAWWLEKSFAQMTYVQQTQAIVTFLQSPLPSVHMLRACARVAPHIWLDPAVHPRISPHLPAHEYARWQMLPLIWDVSSNTNAALQKNRKKSPYVGAKAHAHWGQINRNLTLLYCPSMSSILDTLLVQEQWTKQSTVDALMRTSTKAINVNSSCPSLDLPTLD